MFDISESGNSRSQDPYACMLQGHQREASGWAVTGQFGGGGGECPSQGRWATAFGCSSRQLCWHLLLAPGGLLQACGGLVAETETHITSFVSTVSVFSQATLQTHPILFPMFTCWDSPRSPWHNGSNILPSLPQELRPPHPPCQALASPCSGHGLPHRPSDVIYLAYNKPLAANLAVPHLSSISLLPKNALSDYHN